MERSFSICLRSLHTLKSSNRFCPTESGVIGVWSRSSVTGSSFTDVLLPWRRS
jgi:hypothetical protein